MGTKLDPRLKILFAGTTPCARGDGYRIFSSYCSYGPKSAHGPFYMANTCQVRQAKTDSDGVSYIQSGDPDFERLSRLHKQHIKKVRAAQVYPATTFVQCGNTRIVATVTRQSHKPTKK